MGKNKMSDLQNHLFESLEMLKTGEMNPETAREVSNIGRTLLETAKVEMRYMELLGASRASSPLLASVEESSGHKRPQLPEPVITYRCANHLCNWEGKQKEKDLVRDGEKEQRVCPRCKREQFHRLVNGIVEG